MLKSDSLAKIAPALLAAQKKMGVALKDAKNPFFKSKFADLNTVIDAALPVLNDNDISVLQTPGVSADGSPVVQTVLLHVSGEYIASETPITVAKANDPQALGSAISYARRYGLQATVTIKAEDDDAESAMGRSAGKTSAPIARVEPVKVAPVEAAPTTNVVKPKPTFNKFKPAAASTGDDI